MIWIVLQFVAISGVIIFAGSFLTYNADRLGELTGIGRSLAGLVLLATATSLPELAVECKAAMIPAVDLAVGDALGSSLYNLLILAVIDLSRRTTGRILSPVAAAHALSGTASMVLTGIVAIFLLLPVHLAWQGVGLGTVLVVVSYVFFLRLIYFDHQFAASLTATRIEVGAEPTAPRPSVSRYLAGYIAATGVVFVAAMVLVPTADKLAEQSGLGRTFVGTSLIALSTSLPEMVTTLAAVRMGALELAVGNIFGSNAFNMVILLPVDAIYRGGSLLGQADPTHAITAVAVMIVTGVILAGMLYRAEKRYWIIEPDAVLVVILIASSLALLYYLRLG